MNSMPPLRRGRRPEFAVIGSKTAFAHRSDDLVVDRSARKRRRQKLLISTEGNGKRDLRLPLDALPGAPQE
jgi:hypothetical protein